MANHPPENTPMEPSLLWRTGSSTVMGLVGGLSRTFLYALNDIETPGLERFLQVLEDRKNPSKRTRGLLTGRVTVNMDPRARPLT